MRNLNGAAIIWQDFALQEQKVAEIKKGFKQLKPFLSCPAPPAGLEPATL